jgi:hypothetical protein
VTTFVVSLIAALVSAVLAGAGTYFAARHDLQLKFDASLRDLRIKAYKNLWRTLGALAKYGRRDPLSKDEAQTLLLELKTWYFATGGLVLSGDARQDYFALLDGLEVVVGLTEGTLSAADDEFLRVLGSRLRTAMTRDVGTRRTFVFRGDPEREEPRLESRTYVEAGAARELTLSPRPRLARRLRRLWHRLVADEPELQLAGAEKRSSWDAARRALTVRVSAAGGTVEERIFLLEDGQIVEGPKGWQRGDEVHRRPSVIWSERKTPPGSAS